MTEFDHQTVDLACAVVVTLVPYTEDPEVRQYTAESEAELMELLDRIEDPAHAERVLDITVVDATDWVKIVEDVYVNPYVAQEDIDTIRERIDATDADAVKEELERVDETSGGE